MRLMKRFWIYIDFTAFPRRRKIHFFINIFVGIVIAFFCHLLEHTDGAKLRSIRPLTSSLREKHAIPPNPWNS